MPKTQRGPAPSRKSRKLRLIAVLLIFALAGSVLLIRSFAANPNLPGDVNGDNKVTITDLSILLSNFGKPSATVDLNGDGQVTITDLSILLTNYGKTYSGNPNPNPNPNPQPATYPLRVSANKRYLEGTNGSPFFWQSDTAWNLPGRLNDSEAIQYFDARKSQGFNTVYISLIDLTRSSVDNAQTFNGTKLFNNGDMGSPNPAFFARLDTLISMARERGIQLAIWPAWMQFATRENSYTTSNMTKYGTFLGERYKDTPNIIWTMGGDWGNGPEGLCPHQAEVRALANALKAADPKHLITYHSGAGMSSSDCYHNDGWLDFNGSYWDFNFNNMGSAYTLTYDDYKKTPTKPTIMLETGYEGPSPNDSPSDQMYSIDARMQSAYQVLSGAMGFSYGANSTFRMNNAATGDNTQTWQKTLEIPGAKYQQYIGELFRNRLAKWSTMTPDVNRTVLTAGHGTYGDHNYALASRSADGSLVVAYTSNTRTLTVDMSKLSGTVTARWFDHTGNEYKPISGSPFTNSGSRQFSTPGNNKAGQSDWFLVLETNPV